MSKLLVLKYPQN